MQAELKRRITELQKEFELGQNRLRELEAEEAHVRETLLRISGAIQVLKELSDSAKDEDEAGGGTHKAGAPS